LHLYVAEDLSLGEIAAREGVSRQAVHDLIRRALGSLQEYEARLHLAERWERRLDQGLRLQQLLRAAALRAEEPVAGLLRQAEGLVRELLDDGEG
jgi:predicted DNA-binding protein YlxM (UPF0122 family)